MFGNIITIIFLFFISLIPIVLWGYLFSYFDNNEFNRKRFFIGILAGGLSVIPVLFLGDFIDKTNFLYLNIFSFVSKINDFSSLIKIFSSFLSILFLISVIPFISFFLLPNFRQKIKIYFKKYLIFCLYLVFISFFFFLINLFFQKYVLFDFSFDAGLSFGGIVFNSFKLVVFYYLIIAILEELSKFFCFSYSKKFSIYTIKDGVLYAIFIALGFAFVENILYFKSLYEKFSFGKELIATYFSRNIFSVFLHVICSSVFAYYFSFLYLKFKYKINLEFIKILFFGFLIAIFLHSLFDIFLTFNLSIFIFIYLIGGYFYLTYIFYEE